MNSEDTRKKIELEILTVIEEKLKNGEMSVDRAKSIARLILDKLHPPLSLEQINSVVPTLDDEFSELTQAILPYMQENEALTRATVLEHTDKLIKSGKLIQALATLKQRH